MYRERTTPDIIIYRPSAAGDTEVATVPITEESKRVFKLMEEDYVELRFTLAVPVAFEVGDYIIDEIFGRFLITEKQMPSYDKDTGGYTYTLKFESDYRKWKNHIFMLTAKLSDDTLVRKEADWHLTGNLETHILEIQHNLEVIGDASSQGINYTEFDYEGVETKGEAKYISYSSVSILDALKAIADAFETEYWITYENNTGDGTGTVHFGRCETKDEATVFSLLTNVEEMTIQDDNQTFCNRLYAFGSTQNVPSTYRKKLTFMVEEDAIISVINTKYYIESVSGYIINRDMDSEMLSGVRQSTVGFWVYRSIWFLRYTPSTTSYNYGCVSRKHSECMLAALGGTVTFNGAFSLSIPFTRKDDTVTEASVPVSIRVVVEDTDGNSCGKLYTLSETIELDFTNGATQYYRKDIEFSSVKVALTGGTDYYIRVYYELTLPTDSEGVKTVTSAFNQSTLSKTADGDPITECISIEDGGVTKTAILTQDGNEYPIVWGDEWGVEIPRYGFAFKSVVDGGDEPADFDKTQEFTINFYDGETDGLLINEIPMSWYVTEYDNPSALCSIGDNRLRLPVSTDGYITAKDADGNEQQLTRDQTVEMGVSFDNVFPRCVLVITEIEAVDKTTSEEYEDGSDADWAWTQYKIKAKNLSGDTFTFQKSFIKDGEKLQIKFLTMEEQEDVYETLGVDKSERDYAGDYRLAGMTFDVNFKNLSQVYTIVRNEDYGAKLPNDTLLPVVGDPFILIGWDVRCMEKLGLINIAEKELLTRAEEYLAAIQEDQFAFTCKMFSDTVITDSGPLYTSDDEEFHEATQLPFYVQTDVEYSLLTEGTPAIVQHAALTSDKHSRVIGYEFKLDKPYDSPQYTIGETEAYSRIKTMEKEITKLGGN